MKVLFLYPNVGTELRIPLAISILIAAIRKAGHNVKLFDTTFYGEFHTDDEKMSELGTHETTHLSEFVGKTEKKEIKEEFKKEISLFKPDIICVSLVERNFKTAQELLSEVEVRVLVGGIMPTIAPEFVLKQPWVDYICIGEGEKAIVDFLKEKIPGEIYIWEQLKQNRVYPLIDMNEVPDQDWSDFDERHLLKPFMGKVYRGGAFEFSRGCYKSCTFCVAPKIRKACEGLGKYHRTKSPSRCIEEIEKKIREYQLTMISFGDTDFLSGVSKPVMHDFLSLYAKRIKVPFTIQTGVENLMDEKSLKLLREAQCCAISVGIESGSEKIRKTVIKKAIPIQVIKRAFDLCREQGLRVTANYMVGLPYETEKDIMDTIKLNRYVDPPSIAVTFFTPFMGTELYDICMKEGFYRPFKENVYGYPPLDMPQLKPKKIKKMVKRFTDDFKGYQRDFNIL